MKLNSLSKSARSSLLSKHFALATHWNSIAAAYLAFQQEELINSIGEIEQEREKFFEGSMRRSIGSCENVVPFQMDNVSTASRSGSSCLSSVSAIGFESFSFAAAHMDQKENYCGFASTIEKAVVDTKTKRRGLTMRHHNSARPRSRSPTPPPPPPPKVSDPCPTTFSERYDDLLRTMNKKGSDSRSIGDGSTVVIPAATAITEQDAAVAARMMEFQRSLLSGEHTSSVCAATSQSVAKTQAKEKVISNVDIDALIAKSKVALDMPGDAEFERIASQTWSFCRDEQDNLLMRASTLNAEEVHELNFKYFDPNAVSPVSRHQADLYTASVGKPLSMRDLTLQAERLLSECELRWKDCILSWNVNSRLHSDASALYGFQLVKLASAEASLRRIAESKAELSNDIDDAKELLCALSEEVDKLQVIALK